MSLLVHLLAWTGAPPKDERCLFRHVQPRRLPEASGRLVLAGPAALDRVDSALAEAWLARGDRRLLLAAGRCDASAVQTWLALGGVEIVPPDELSSALTTIVRELEIGLVRWRLEPEEYLPRWALPFWLTGDRRPATGDRRPATGEDP